MGNESTSLTDHQLVRTYRPEEWLKQALDQNGQFWRNKFSHQLVNLYPLQKIPSIQDMHRYQLRSTHQYLVKVFNIAMCQHGSVCNFNQMAMLLIEHIPLKLNDITSLDLQEALTALHSSFRGFHTIQSLFQLVQPQEELIGFNEQGKTKVWLNQQLNNNFISKQSKPSELSQFGRVIKILEIIHRKIPANRQFYNLRQEILQHNVNYFEASIIIEQFAFRQQLSLKRFVRTDILTRQNKKVETHRRNTTMSTIIPTQRSNISGVRKSEINFNFNHPKNYNETNKITPIRTSYIIRNQPLRFNEQVNSRKLSAVGSSPSLTSRKSIPKITFTNNHELIGSPKLKVVSNLKPKIVFVSSNIEQKVAYFSTINGFHKNLLPQILKQSTKQNNQNEVEQQKLNTENIIKQQTEKQIKEKLNEAKITENRQTTCENKAQNNKVEDSPVIKLQFSQKRHSIIDQCEKYLDESKHNNKPENQQLQQNLQVIQIPSGQDIQQSGMFRQIEEKEVKVQTKQVQTELRQKTDSIADKVIIQKNSNMKKQMPINFQSFAVEKITYVENVSFAPNLTQIQFSNQNLAGTTKSLDIQEKQEENEPQVQSAFCQSQNNKQEPPKKNFKLFESQEGVLQAKKRQATKQLPFGRVQPSKNITRSPLYYQLQKQFSAICQQEKPFYESYTPVQSKFDIVIKKDSNIEKEREATERSNGLSAFGNVDQDEGYDRSIKKFKQIYPAEELRINRITSEYQTITKKNHDSSRQSRPQPRINKFANINEGTQQDFLDVNNLQKTLQMKCSKKLHKKSDEFDVSKLQQKLLKFSSSRRQIGQQNSQRQSTLTKSKDHWQNSYLGLEKKEDKKYLNKQSQYQQTIVFSKDYQPYSQTNRYKTYIQQYNPIIRQQDAITRNNYKYNSYTYKRYPQITQQNIYSQSRFDYSKGIDIYDNYEYNSNRHTDTLPQNSKLKKNSDFIFEEKYQKYVKQAKQKPTLSKQKSVQNFSKVYQTPKQKQSQRSKRISYDNLRQYLWN